jgi:flagella basal body P-ring formation protein FlgA
MDGRRKTLANAPWIIALTLGAWGAQSLVRQCVRGANGDAHVQIALADDAAAAPQSDGPAEPVEKFVPGTSRYIAGATLEVRGEATITGAEVKLRQVCRWSDADKAAFAPMADLVVCRIAPNTPYRSISMDELKQTLHDAGVNLGVVRFAGATTCTVTRNDVRIDERTALEQWVASKQAPAQPVDSAALASAAARAASAMAPPVAVASENHLPTVMPAPARTATSPAPAGESGASVASFKPSPAPVASANHTLRELLLQDLAERAGVSVDALQMRFNTADAHLLNLSQPTFQFDIDDRRARSLGDISWDVTINAAGASRRMTISSAARAWQEQVICREPLAYRQVIKDSDLVDRRVLVDMMTIETPATRAQLVGNMASRELVAGSVLTTRMIDPVPLVQPNQLVTLIVRQGGVQIRSEARAMEAGAFGQNIRVRNETSRDVFSVTVTGPQQATMTAGAGPQPTGGAAASAPGAGSVRASVASTGTN